MNSLDVVCAGGENIGFLSDVYDEDDDGGGMNKPVAW